MAGDCICSTVRCNFNYIFNIFINAQSFLNNLRKVAAQIQRGSGLSRVHSEKVCTGKQVTAMILQLKQLTEASG